MNTHIEHIVKQCATCLEYQHTQQQERALHYEIPHRPWEMVSVDIYMVNGKTILCTVEYYSKFQIVKMIGSLSADDLVKMAQLILTEYGLPRNIVSDANTNVTSEAFKEFCGKMNIQQSIASSYHKNNGQVEACKNVLNAYLRNVSILLKISV